MSIATVNIHDAKSNLSKLEDNISKGGSFIIAKGGKTVARIMGIQKKPRTGMLQGICKIPEDFDSMMADEIEKQFSIKLMS